MGARRQTAAGAMKLVQIYLPRYDNAGRRLIVAPHLLKA